MPDFVGAGERNRTAVISLEGCCSTIELHPRKPDQPDKDQAPVPFPLPTQRFQQNKLGAVLLPFRPVNRGTASASLAVYMCWIAIAEFGSRLWINSWFTCFLAAVGTSDAV